MKIGALSLLNRTSSARTFNLASWHSSHSLTWRWILSLHRQPFGWPKPWAHRNTVGMGAGLGQLLAAHVYRTNNGPQLSLSMFWHSLDFHQQRPMWFRDMYRRAQDREAAAESENHRLRDRLGEAQHLAARQANPMSGANLN